MAVFNISLKTDENVTSVASRIFVESPHSVLLEQAEAASSTALAYAGYKQLSQEAFTVIWQFDCYSQTSLAQDMCCLAEALGITVAASDKPPAIFDKVLSIISEYTALPPKSCLFIFDRLSSLELIEKILTNENRQKLPLQPLVIFTLTRCYWEQEVGAAITLGTQRREAAMKAIEQFSKRLDNHNRATAAVGPNDGVFNDEYCRDLLADSKDALEKLERVNCWFPGGEGTIDLAMDMLSLRASAAVFSRNTMMRSVVVDDFLAYVDPLYQRFSFPSEQQKYCYCHCLLSLSSIYVKNKQITEGVDCLKHAGPIAKTLQAADYPGAFELAQSISDNLGFFTNNIEGKLLCIADEYMPFLKGEAPPKFKHIFAKEPAGAPSGFSQTVGKYLSFLKPETSSSSCAEAASAYPEQPKSKAYGPS